MAKETKEELRAMADELVADGMEPVPLDATADDLRAAIDKHKSQLPDLSDEPEGPASITLKVTGPYRVFDHRRGQTFTGAVKVNDDTGGRIIVVGNEWANLDALLAMDFVEEVKS